MDKKLKILLVDDDKMNRLSTCRFLKSSGLSVDVEEVVHIKEALIKIKEIRFDCILLDNNLLDGTGVEWLASLSPEEKTKAPIIIITGGGDEMVAVQALKNGAADYIPKDRLGPDILESSILRSIKVNDLENRSRAAEEELVIRETEFREVLDSVPDIIIKLDISRNITFVNQAVNFLGFEPDSLIGKSIKELVGQDAEETLLTQLATRRVGPRATTNLEIPLHVSKSSMFYDSIKPVQVLIDAKGLWNVPDEEVLRKENDKKTLGTLLVAKNITEQKKIENELKESNIALEKISNQDGLTGIANRYCFDEFISREIKRASRDKTVISLVMMDIDYFKKV